MENLAKQVNSLPLQENIKNLQGALISLHGVSFKGGRMDVSTDNVARNDLKEIAKSCRTSTRNTGKDLQGLIASVDMLNKDVSRKKIQLASKDKDILTLDGAMNKFKEQVDREESIYNEEILMR